MSGEGGGAVGVIMGVASDEMMSSLSLSFSDVTSSNAISYSITSTSISSSSSEGGGIEELKGMGPLTIVLSCISMMCCLLVFTSLLRTKDYLIPPYFGVVNLSVSDFFNGLATVMAQSTSGERMCNFCGFIAQTTDLAGNMWLSFIALSLFFLYKGRVESVLTRKGLINGSPSTVPSINKKHLLACVCLWILAMVTAIIPLTGFDSITYQEGAIGTCWISASPLMARFLLFYIPLWFMIVLVGLIYVVVISLHPLLGPNNYTPRQFLYPITMLIIWIPCTVNRILESIGLIVPATEYWQASVLPMWGLIDCTIYLITKLPDKQPGSTLWDLYCTPLPSAGPV
ncbi:hypothetical protein Pelo_3115 [Pelomyxa schiedti]|nr:hypothetical protein Pelo_3115 [Pelomyxa schiedti]